MNTYDRNMSLTGQPPKNVSAGQKWATLLGLAGLFILLLAVFNIKLPGKGWWLALSLGLIFGATYWYSKMAYANKEKGIKNDGVWFKSISSRGFWAWVAGIAFTGFYIILYFFPEYLGLVQGGQSKGLISLFDPLSKMLSGNAASQWFV
ncbi:MAG: FeS-binding protein, partial [Flavobacteriaceae bacterium]|nr:FeS-binding protein [Flavobacteriaceae bacterium]